MGYGGLGWFERLKVFKIILQKGQGIVKKSRRRTVSIRGSAVSWPAGVQNGFLDGGGAFDTVRWGSNPPESPRKFEPLCTR